MPPTNRPCNRGEVPGKKRLRLGFVLLVALLMAASLAPQGPASATREVNLKTFDAAWRMVAETHFDATFNGVDWDQVRDELRPRAAEAEDRAELRLVLEEMVARLGQSHFTFLSAPGGASRLERADSLPSGCAQEAWRSLGESLYPATGRADKTGATGLELRAIDDQVLVRRVDAGTGAAEAGVRSGWSVASIEGLSIQDALPCLEGFEGGHQRQQILQTWLAQLFRGAVGSTVHASFEKADGTRVDLGLERMAPHGELVKFGNLPPIFTHLDVRWLSSEEGSRVAVVEFNAWMLPVALRFDAVMDEIREADGIVIDLRGNRGGIAAIAQGVAGHFVDEKTSLGTMKSRNNDLKMFVNPRRSTRDGRKVEPYSGPLAILVDGMSASTSEVFAAGLQDLGRARLFGEPTAGAALPAVAESLPNGDVFLHATMDFIRPGGGRVEGHPVQPDVSAPVTRSDLVAGIDAALDKALAWIDETRHAASDG